MITAEDTYDVAGQILELPLGVVHPATDNVRTDLGDLEGLAASIRDVGVLQAIRVMPNATGDEFTILVGHRRYAAAQLAGILTIPAVIDMKPEDAKLLVARIVENIQRLDLPALDEARSYRRLEKEFGLSQSDIATRVGCSQSHVSKRLALLTLPKKVQKLVAAGELGIGDAVELTKLADEPKRIDAALLSVENGSRSITRAVEHELDAREGEKLVTDAVTDAAAKNIKVLYSRATTTENTAEGQKRQRALAGVAQLIKAGEGGFHSGTVLELEKLAPHAKEPCHAITLILNWGNKLDRVAYCTDPRRHTPKGDSTLKAVKKAKAPVDPTLAAEKVAENEALEARRAFVHDVVRTQRVDKAYVIAEVLRTFATTTYEPKKRCELLGIDLNGRMAGIALTDYVNGGTDNVLRACLAAMLERAEHPYGPLDRLLALGYEPTQWERDLNEERDAEDAASEAYERVADIVDRANELADASPDIADRAKALEAELDNGPNTSRVLEIRAELDAIFIELNNLRPGDHDGEGHTIDRTAGEPDVDENGGAVLCAFPGCTLNDEHDGDHDPNLDEGAKVDGADDDTEAHAAPASASEAIGSPGSTEPPRVGNDDAEGAAASVLTRPTKLPKDQGHLEQKCWTLFDLAIAQRPDDVQLAGIQHELCVGIDEDRAAEVLANLQSIYAQIDAEDTNTERDDYTGPPANDTERRLRSMIAELPADHARVAEIQQRLYRGEISVAEGAPLTRELKKLKGALS